MVTAATAHERLVDVSDPAGSPGLTRVDTRHRRLGADTSAGVRAVATAPTNGFCSTAM